MSSYTGPVIINREIWELKGLIKSEKHVLSLICNLSKKDGCYASNNYLSKILQLAPKTIANIKSNLVKKRYLKIIRNSIGKKAHVLHSDFKRVLFSIPTPNISNQGKKSPLERKKPSLKREHISKNQEKFKNSSKKNKKISENLKREGFIRQEILKIYKNYTEEEIQEGLKNYYLNIQKLKSQGKTWTKGLLFYKIKEAKQTLSIKQVQQEKIKKKNKKILKEDYILNNLELPESFRLDIRKLIEKRKGLKEIQDFFKERYSNKKEIIIA